MSIDVEAWLGNLLAGRAPPGQLALARGARRWFEQQLGARLVTADDSLAALEPLAVARLSDPHGRGDLAATVLPMLDPSDRPAVVIAPADDDGVVELPGIGHIRGNRPHVDVEIAWGGEDHVDVRRPEGREHMRLTPIETVPGTRAVVAPTIHPFFRRFFAVDTAACPLLATRVTTAFQLIAQATPTLHTHLADAVRRVSVHRAGHVPSFATPRAHGAVFLAVTDDQGDVGLAEDLVHQGGHVLCTAMTVDRDLFFAREPSTPLGSITGSTIEPRTLYEAFHGVFTEAAMVLFLTRVLDEDILDGQQQHEALGRLALIASRTGRDLADLSIGGLFTDEGTRVLHLCRAALADALERRRHELRTLDLRDQPYAFSYTAFAARNPLSCSS